MRRLLPFVVLAAACTGELAQPSDVRDLRVLAIRAEPPEVLEADLPEDAVLQALVADPTAADRTIAWEWWACGLTNDLRCASDENARSIGSGEGRLDEVTTAFTLTSGMVRDAREWDTFLGFGGVYVMTELVLAPGQPEELHAIKQIPVPAGLPPGTTPNANPGPPRLRHDDVDWSDDEVLAVAPGQEVSVEPAPAADTDAEHYSVYRFDLQVQELDEYLDYRFFATDGSWNRNSSGGRPSPVVTETTLASIWTAPDPAPADDVTVWVVVRDGRGGIAWTTRTVRVGQ